MNEQGCFHKGIIFARSAGARLFPVTAAIPKSLVPIFDKPMIYYPLSTLVMAGVREVLIIAGTDEIRAIERLLHNGARLGLRIEYAPKSAMHTNALQIGRRFIDDQCVAMILADQLLYGTRFELALLQAVLRPRGATIFAKRVANCRHYDTIEYGRQGNPISILPGVMGARGKAAITGLYMFDQQIGRVVADVFARCRHRITFADILQAYLDRGELNVVDLDSSSSWFDVGTHEVQLAASIFVDMVQNEHGKSIGCVEEVAFQRGLINAERLLELSARGENEYCRYLRRVALSAISR